MVKRATQYLILFLLTIAIGWRALPPTAMSAALPQPASPSSFLLRPVFLSDGPSIKRMVSDPSGDLAFTSGEIRLPFFFSGSDSLFLVRGDRTVKLVAAGNPVPGRDGTLVALYLSFSPNGRGDAAFSALTSNPNPNPFDTSNPFQQGVFLFSETNKRTIALAGDAAPGTAGGVFWFFSQMLVNDKGMVLFEAGVGRGGVGGGAATEGLFLYSEGQIERIIIGSNGPLTGTMVRPFGGFLFLSDAGVVTFQGYTQGDGRPTLFRYEKGALSKLLASGDPAPGGGSLGSIVEPGMNARGDVVFHSSNPSQASPASESLNVRGNDGSMSRIVGNGDPTPIGGQFQFVLVGGGSSGPRPYSATLSPTLNDSRDVAFKAAVTVGGDNNSIFLSHEGVIRKVVTRGDHIPGEPFTIWSVGAFHLNDSGQLLFSAALNAPARSGLFLYSNENTSRVFAEGDTAPGTGGESFTGFFGTDFGAFSLSDSGEVSFHATLCCGRFIEGIFRATVLPADIPHPNIPNGGFEMPGKRGLPAHWHQPNSYVSRWYRYNGAEAFQYTGVDVFEGNSILRLHVLPGGGHTCVLSDPISISADSFYQVTSKLRYNLTSDSGAVSFAVLQLDVAGNQVGFDELVGKKGENSGSWSSKEITIHTNPASASIRIRFSLVSKTEAFLDVDDVR